MRRTATILVVALRVVGTIVGLFLAFVFVSWLGGVSFKIYDKSFTSIALIAALGLAAFLLQQAVSHHRRLAGWLMTGFAVIFTVALLGHLQDALAKGEFARTDRYLKGLKELDLPNWLGRVKAPVEPARSAQSQMAHQENEVGRQTESASIEQQRLNPSRYLALDVNWHPGGFGIVMIADFVVKSSLPFQVQDIVITCKALDGRGAQISQHRAIAYELIPAKATIRLPNVNMGLMSSDTARTSCEVMHASLGQGSDPK